VGQACPGKAFDSELRHGCEPHGSLSVGSLGKGDNVNGISRTRISPWLFFVLVFSLSWGCWILAAILSTEGATLLTRLLHYAGGFGPTAVTIALIYFQHTPDFRRDFWRRAIEFKRISTMWYGVILLTVPILTALGAMGDVLLGGKGLQLEAAERFVEQPWMFLPFALFMLIFGPLPEELAWRGYVLDGLQVKWNALASSLILGVAWTVWHLPLFFIQGSYQHGLGLGTEQFWLYMMDKVPLSILMTWIFNNNRRSTLSAILLHFMVNLIGELFDLTLRAEVFTILLWIIVAIGVTVLWGPEKLARDRGEKGG
jgi:membrane protease YdiL (CAAX protease family)